MGNGHAGSRAAAEPANGATRRAAGRGRMKPSTRRYDVTLTEPEWRAKLTPAEYAVLREGGTEPAFTGEYSDTHTEGVYSCRACGAELFRSREKFDSHCGWPSFFAPLAADRVEYITDRSFGM